VHFRFYTTVTETALILSEFEWAQNFINSYKDKLPEDIRENTFNYANAMFEFAAGNFSTSLEILSKISYNDVYHKIKCKCLLAMLYYELGYNDQLLSHIDSFNHFIINDRFLNKERKKYYSNFIRYIKKIERIRQYNLFDNIEAQKQKITTDNTLYYKDWLLKKLDEFK
jgi:uracil phosphoribosyltransferase